MASHVSIVPADPLLFPLAQDAWGTRLALVFGNQAAGGECPFYTAKRCHHCDIGAGEGGQFTDALNLERLDWFRQKYRDVWGDVAHFVLYNSGSVLNPRELGPAALAKVLVAAAAGRQCRLISLDTRENFVSLPRLAWLDGLVPRAVAIHPILGVESMDSRIRNDVLDKRMSRDGIVRAFDAVAAVAQTAATGRWGLDVNLVVGTPGTRGDDEALRDVLDSAREVWELGRQRGLPVDLNLHPYYPSARSSRQFPQHPRCSAGVLAAARDAVAALRERFQFAGTVFVGTHHEGHDQQS